jgi:hypothetical protein
MSSRGRGFCGNGSGPGKSVYEAALRKGMRRWFRSLVQVRDRGAAQGQASVSGIFFSLCCVQFA